jgi:hypothetical protein
VDASIHAFTACCPWWAWQEMVRCETAFRTDMPGNKMEVEVELHEDILDRKSGAIQIRDSVRR